jgi:sensor c-di-GMP phosphodiesterase-like protein
MRRNFVCTLENTCVVVNDGCVYEESDGVENRGFMRGHSITEVWFRLQKGNSPSMMRAVTPIKRLLPCSTVRFSGCVRAEGRKSRFLNYLLMTVLHQRRLGWCLAIFGLILGAFAGFWLGRGMLLRTAKADLSDYAQQLNRNADALRGELSVSFSELNMPRFPRCSNPDLWALQARTFRSSDLKDIGRTHNGMLYCSAVLGKLKKPYVESIPTLVLADGTQVYADVALVLASMGGDHGTVVESGDLNAVLSPNAFDHWNRPHVRYMIVAVDRKTNRMARIAGSSLSLQTSQVLSQGLAILAGTIYRRSCSDRNQICAVTSESLADVWGSSRTTQVVYSAMGAFAGLSVGLLGALLYQRTHGLSHQLHCAIRRSSPSLRLVYEPILDSRTCRTVGAETLLRWTDQTGASIPPDVFVRMAEEKGFVDELTAFVVRRAIQEMGNLLRLHPYFTLSINIAASDMNGHRLLGLLKKEVLRAEVSPEQIALELTERSTADLAVARSAIRRLREAGYKVHIDDFGTGFSSLSYIDQLAVNAIKIDRSFTRAVGTDAVTAPLLPQMIAMAESLGVEVIVEGVETEVQRKFLSANEKPLRLQGWLFSKALSAEALRSFLDKNDVLGDNLRANPAFRCPPEAAVLLAPHIPQA